MTQCEHNILFATMDSYPDEQTFLHMPEKEVRAKYPRIVDDCPECGEELILYKSKAHFIAGEW